MNDILIWWDDAVALAHRLAEQTDLRHRVTAVLAGGEGVTVTVGWRVDLATGEHRLTQTWFNAEFWSLISHAALDSSTRPEATR